MSLFENWPTVVNERNRDVSTGVGRGSISY
jgi:hypothetical protein